MLVYIPATFEDEDYRPSWTGNYTYKTVTIRGIFESYELAEAAASNWDIDNYTILERYCGEDDESYSSFDIDYLYGRFEVWGDSESGYYNLNEIVDEEWSAVYDEEQTLGVTDY